MATREYQFIVGAETSTLPTSGTPTDPSDTITLGYADDHYVQGGEPVADLTALAAVASGDRANGDVLLVLSSNSLYRFDSGSAASADGLRIVSPASGSGRWFIIRPGETASNGDYAVAGDITIGGDATITGDVEVTGNATINGTLTAINSTTLEVVDANILINNGGNTASADLADAGFTVEISDGTNAKVGYNSTLASKFMCGNVGSESEIITAANTQVMTGVKTFDAAPNFLELGSTPTTPASGYQRIYPKTDGKFYRLDDAGNEQELGSGGGAGGINYILNSDAETDAAGWVAYADAAASTPVDGTGGSPNVTITRSTASPLRGIGSFLISKDAANRQGQGASYDFTIDSADVSKTLQISFDVNGSAGYVAGDLTCYIYDVTNSVLITPAAISIANAKYLFQTTFVATSSTSYRLIFHVASTNASAWDITLDNVNVGPQIYSLGTPITDWEVYTPTGSWSTNATYSGLKRRVGSMLQLKIKMTLSGANTQGNLSFTVPETMDSSLVLSTGSKQSETLGQVKIYDANTTQSISGVAVYNSATTLDLLFMDDTATGVGQVNVNGASNNPITFASGDFISMYAEVPIAAWTGSSVYTTTAQPEYAYNSGTWNADDTTSFAYGPSGAAMGGALAANRNKRVRFLTPIQSTDEIVVLASADRIAWTPINDSVLNSITVVKGVSTAGAINAGVSWTRVSGSTTDIDVNFARYINVAPDDAPVVDWPSTNAFWKVVKKPGTVQTATPYFQQTSVLSLDNEFTGGTIRVSRVGNMINISLVTAATHSSASSRSSSVGLIPSWARPELLASSVTNIATAGAAAILSVATNGTFAVRYLDGTFALSNQTGTSTGNLSYAVLP